MSLFAFDTPCKNLLDETCKQESVEEVIQGCYLLLALYQSYEVILIISNKGPYAFLCLTFFYSFLNLFELLFASFLSTMSHPLFCSYFTQVL
ncbi:hypothetical protein BDR22DRAFT_875778 [Usnea florida]